MGGARLFPACAMTHTYVRHDSTVIWVVRDFTHSCVCHDSYICATWLNCDMGGARLHSFLRVPWLIHVRDMTHLLYERYESWLIHACAMTHAYVRHDSSLECSHRVTTLVICVVWDMTHLCGKFECVPWLIPGVPWLIHACDMSHHRNARIVQRL